MDSCGGFRIQYMDGKSKSPSLVERLKENTTDLRFSKILPYKNPIKIIIYQHEVEALTQKANSYQ